MSSSLPTTGVPSEASRTATARPLAAFSDASAAAPPAQPKEPLTSREEEVLVKVARGRTNAEIADAVHQLSTTKTHLASLMNKLGARNRVALAMDEGYFGERIVAAARTPRLAAPRRC